MKTLIIIEVYHQPDFGDEWLERVAYCSSISGALSMLMGLYTNLQVNPIGNDAPAPRRSELLNLSGTQVLQIIVERGFGIKKRIAITAPGLDAGWLIPRRS